MFRYPGGKKRFKNFIIPYIRKFLVNNDYEYVEPFFGGGSVGIFVLNNINKICINDKDESLCCLWNSIIHKPNELIDLINEFNPKKEDFFDIKKILIENKDCGIDNLEIGFKKLIIHQISYSGLGTKAGGPIGGKSQKSKYSVDCRWNPVNLKKEIKKISKLFNRVDIRNGKCTNFDFEKILSNKTKSFFYLDPPYFIKGRELYEESFNGQDHVRLMKNLRQNENPWLLSYDNCSYVRDLYDWAIIQEIDINYTINTIREKKELLICSPLYKNMFEKRNIKTLF
jgi:DNA adenine methylase